MINLIIVPATAEDLPEILEVRYDSFCDSAPSSYSNREVKVLVQDVNLEEIRRMISENTLFKACDPNGLILGCCGWYKQNLRHLYVRPEFYKHGIGRQLVTFAETHFLKNSGYAVLKLGSMAYAYEFYKKLGFTLIQEKRDWDGSRYYEFEKKLKL